MRVISREEEREREEDREIVKVEQEHRKEGRKATKYVLPRSRYSRIDQHLYVIQRCPYFHHTQPAGHILDPTCYFIYPG